MLPIWVILTALAFPLVVFSLAAIGSDFLEARVEPQANGDPVVFTSNTLWFGPFTVTTNTRRWAGACILVGLILIGLGLAGLFHFPTPMPSSMSVVQEQDDSFMESLNP